MTLDVNFCAEKNQIGFEKKNPYEKKNCPYIVMPASTNVKEGRASLLTVIPYSPSGTEQKSMYMTQYF